MSGSELAQYLRRRFGPGMFLANLCGAIDVFVLLVWILPTPGVPPGGLVAQNAIAFVLFPVNEAARLCERAKGMPGRVLASEAILQRAEAGESARWQLEDEVLLRGRQSPTRTAAPLAA